VARARILLVDDEPQLLQLVQKYLQRLDYEVEAHVQASEALKAYESAAQRYDMVIADLQMPGLSGEVLLEKMLRINPKLRLLVCTGSSFALSSVPSPIQNQIGFLQKPFAPNMLAEAVGELLARGRE